MLSPDERLMIGLKALERLKPKLSAQRLRRPKHNPLDLPGRPDGDAVNEMPAEDLETGSISLDALPDLKTMLALAGPLPPYSLILGTCEDGLPFLLDLANPAPGALLVAADAGAGKTRLLRAILASATALNGPEEVLISLFTRNPEAFSEFSKAPNCQEILGPGEEAAVPVLIRSLADSVEQRRRSSLRGPALILAIDDLASFNHELDDEATAQFHSILVHGPRTRVWTLASLASEDAGQVDERLLAAFRTRLIGKISDPNLAQFLANDATSKADELAGGYQFCVPFGEEWIRFWVCNER
jgi:hypothetical protein